MEEQTEIRRKLGITIYELSDNILVASHDKPEEERVTKSSSSAHMEQFVKRKRSDDDTTRKASKTSRPSASVEVDQSLSLALVDNSTATGRVEVAIL